MNTPRNKIPCRSNDTQQINGDRYRYPHITKSDIEEIIGKVIPGYKISDESLPRYQQAFVHKSTTNQIKKLMSSESETTFTVPQYMLRNNERMEFLGDSYLGASTRLYLFNTYPNKHQGQLTDISNRLVCGPQCTEFADKIGMRGKILMSERTERMIGHTNDRLLEDTFEAFICAIYMDGGIETVNKFVENLIKNFADKNEYLTNTNYKAMLLDYCQEKKISPPEYHTQYEKTVKGNEKRFGILVTINKQRRGRGEGKKIKEAEMAAAKHALERLGLLKILQNKSP